MSAAERHIPDSLDGLLQMISQNDEKHDDAHKRLRVDLEGLERDVTSGLESVRSLIAQCEIKIAAVAATPVHASKIVVTPGVLASIIMSALMIAGGIWGSTYGLKSDMRDILTRMQAQQAAAEVQNQSLTNSINEMRRRQELQQFEIQELSKVLLGRK